MPNPSGVEAQLEGQEPDVTIEEAENVTVDASGGIQPIPAIAETKPGVKTTEFWVLIVAQVLIYLPDVLKDVNLPDQVQLIVSSLVGVGYILSRGIAKKGVPYVEQT